MPEPSPRNEERPIVPSISMTIQIGFYVNPVPFVGRLWDVSASGASLPFPIRGPVVPGLAGSLTIPYPTFLPVLMRRSGDVTPVVGPGDLRSCTAFGGFG
jgi:hypothetical protein